MRKDFEVELELKDDLSESDRVEILEYMKEWAGRFGVVSKDGKIYFKENPEHRGDEFGSVSFFYAQLLDKKEFFKILKYSDYANGEFDVAAGE